MPLHENTNLLCQYENRFRNDLREKKRSLFLSALSLTNEECTTIFEALRAASDNQPFYWVRLGLFLREFFRSSDGKEFHRLWDTIPNNSKKTLEETWIAVYGRNTPVDNAHIKAKCWILAGEERDNEQNVGDSSVLWDCLRDAVDSYRDSWDSNSIFVQSNGDKKRKFVDYLFADDSIERREYRKLASLLADQDSELLVDEEEVWQKQVKFALPHIQKRQNPRYDWYLRLDDDCAEYIVGLDNFPKTGGKWEIAIGSEKHDIHISSTTEKSCSSFPISWNDAIEVSLPPSGRKWRTFPIGASCCFQTSESIPFAVFVRHRVQGSDDIRRYWWKQQTKPVLLRNQSEFIVCSLDKEVVDSLEVQSNNKNLGFQETSGGTKTFWISNPGGRVHETQFYAKRFCVDCRPENEDVSLSITTEGGSPVQVLVSGNRPFIERKNGDQSEIQTDKPGFLIHKAGDEISLVLRNARPNEFYRWTLHLDGKTLESQGDRSCCFRLNPCDDGEPVPFSVVCRSGDGKAIASVKGAVLPSFVYNRILAGNPGSCVTNGWQVRAQTTDPIQDRINGFRQFEIISRIGGKNIFRVPLSGKDLNWWFENCKGERSNLISASSPVREIKPVEIYGNNPLFICLPPEVDCPANWRMSVDGEYWRQPVSELVRVETFVYDQDSPLSDFKLQKNATLLFRYQPTPERRQFCKDRFGRLGLFVPGTDNATYDIVAYADDDADILSGGEVLTVTMPRTPFTDIQDAWDGFRRNHHDADAFLIAFRTETKHRLDFRSTAQELKNRSDTDWFWSERKGFQNNALSEYRDQNTLNVVTELRELYSESAESFPLRQTDFFRSSQTLTYETVRSNWRKRVSGWREYGAKPEDADVWFYLWEDNGFSPILNPDVWVAVRPWMKGTDSIPWYPPEDWPVNVDWWHFYKQWVRLGDIDFSDKVCGAYKAQFDDESWKRIGKSYPKLFGKTIRHVNQRFFHGNQYHVRLNQFSYRSTNQQERDKKGGARLLINHILFFENKGFEVANTVFNVEADDCDVAKDAVRTFAKNTFQENDIGDSFADAIDLLIFEQHNNGRSILLALALLAAMCPSLARNRIYSCHSDVDCYDHRYSKLAKAFRFVHQSGNQPLWDDFCLLELRCEILIDELKARGY